MTPRGAHRAATLVVSAALVVIGLVLIVQGASTSHGVDYPRLLLGALFAAAGVARLHRELRRGGER
ncbi:MAG TPA: hypothetical protein VLZ06_01745 [Solirubrobacteraceae bacterium]|nr:hypothetical protein [Solirubrobacteraceae bacterium]